VGGGEGATRHCQLNFWQANESQAGCTITLSETRRPSDRDRIVTTGPAVSSPPAQKCAEMPLMPSTISVQPSLPMLLRVDRPQRLGKWEPRRARARDRLTHQSRGRKTGC